MYLRSVLKLNKVYGSRKNATGGRQPGTIRHAATGKGEKKFWNHLFNQTKKEGVITDGYNSDNRRIWKLQQKVTAQDLPFTKDENSDAPPF